MFDQAFAALAALILVAGPLAVGVTKITDLIRNAADANDTAPKWIWNIVPIVLGIGLCIGWGIDLVGAVVAAIPALAEADISDFTGQLLTGIVVGSMAGFWHEKMDQWSAWAHQHRPTLVIEDDTALQDPLDLPLSKDPRRNPRT